MNTPLQTALMQKAVMLCTLSSMVSSTVWLGMPLDPLPKALPKALTALVTPTAQAQQLDPQERQDFLADPLEDPRDPLLPVLAVERALSPLELSMLAADLESLQRQAEALLQTGMLQQAFDLLLREVRLRRLFGLDAELEAIERVAALAWQQQRPVTIQLLTLRTREIWNAAQTDLGVEPKAVLGGVDLGRPEDSPISGVPSADERALTTLAEIFITLRDIDSAVEVYQQLIVLAEDNNQAATAQQIALAELNLDWFKFAAAANVYLDLLAQARESGETDREILYLERLVYSYQQAESWPNALRSQTDLLDRYIATGEEEKLPGLLVAIAQNYQAVDQPNNAIRYYRSAYAAAQQLEQFSFSAKVLQELGQLYRTVDDLSEALISYNLLILVEQQAYNDYGLMNAYDNLGQIYRQQGELAEALKTFQQGLVFADRLDLRVDYFTEQIEAISQELSELDVPDEMKRN
ncbi:tetratricopeptide repeat protein [cf. Phormidesmis sp. LEGE 11477]|uniref:tetratricopeptide repeat protein n=1 Tax=cf. Phormidesmis sp. LEGE 11477 TaxID=1828680 RepID=UPI00188020FE|nr:tetratricopeptide repeat protein [cf. Phormidesmis sp. LEGE 11477]